MLKHFNKSDFVILAFLVILLSIFTLKGVPIGYAGHFNFDESIELVRVHLLSRGYVFFDEVWNDHPLGLPWVLYILSNFFDIDFTSARLIILSFSAINLSAFYLLLRLDCKALPSFFSSLLLMTSALYIPLTGAIFNEMPSLALGTLSILLMSLYSRSSTRLMYLFLALSAFSFTLSLEIKISVLVLLPTLLVIGLGRKMSGLPKKAIDAAIWMSFAFSSFLLLTLTIMPFSFQHLIASHRNAGEKMVNVNPNLDLTSLIEIGLNQDFFIVILSLSTLIMFLFSKRKELMLPPLTWLGFNLLRFGLTAPVWPNYYIHLIMPSCWLIGLCIDEFRLFQYLSYPRLFLMNFTSNIQNKIVGESKPKFLYLFLILFPLSILLQILVNSAEILTASTPRRYQNKFLVAYNNWGQPREDNLNRFSGFLEQYRNTDKVILTDNPFFIHNFELDTPPETAVLSRKRVVTEGIDGDYIFNVVTKEQPDFILLDRFAKEFLQSQLLLKALDGGYKEHPLSSEDKKLFVRVVN